MKDHSGPGDQISKFFDPYVTADGSERASVHLTNPQTLWFNTGTRCNIECRNCYIESSPANDRLVYLSTSEVQVFLDQIKTRGWPITEIGVTGGEPYMNPEIIEICEASLRAGFRLLVLTNAMRPMMRDRVRGGIAGLNARYPGQMTLRVSLDHYGARRHDQERGADSFAATLKGMAWLRDQSVPMAVAGRTMWGEDEAATRAGFGDLFARNAFDIDAQKPGGLVLFPEMDAKAPVPEITTACWDILGKNPADVMCASSRMVVKRKGADRPVVLSCTLLPYDAQFEMGGTLAEAEKPVQLNHPHCAKFCVLGGASCSV